MTVIQPNDRGIPLNPPEWTDKEIDFLEAEWLTDRYHLSVTEMRSSVNLEFENAFDWLLWTLPSTRRFDPFVQVTLTLSALHLALID